MTRPRFASLRVGVCGLVLLAQACGSSGDGGATGTGGHGGSAGATGVAGAGGGAGATGAAGTTGGSGAAGSATGGRGGISGVAGTGGSAGTGTGGGAGSAPCPCAGGRLCCRNTCVNPQNDPFNCGACGKVCGAPARECSGGQCVSPSCGNIACSAELFCCGNSCCSPGDLCCASPVSLPVTLPACHTPTAGQPTCAPG